MNHFSWVNKVDCTTNILENHRNMFMFNLTTPDFRVQISIMKELENYKCTIFVIYVVNYLNYMRMPEIC